MDQWIMNAAEQGNIDAIFETIYAINDSYGDDSPYDSYDDAIAEIKKWIIRAAEQAEQKNEDLQEDLKELIGYLGDPITLLKQLLEEYQLLGLKKSLERMGFYD